MLNGTPPSRINLIDIFGYIIPGTVLLAGGILAININLVLSGIPTIAGISIIGIFAFVTSFILSHLFRPRWIRILARYRPRYEHRFPRDLFQAQEQAPKNFEDDTDTRDYFDYQVWEICRDKFSLPDNLSKEKYRELWFGILSYLETTSYTRAFRMQALYIFSANMTGISVTLMIFYAVLTILKGASQVVGPIRETNLFMTSIRPIPNLIGLLIISFIFALVFATLSLSFLSKWHLYSKMELFIDQKMRS